MDITLISEELITGGFTSGNNGIWTRNAPDSPPAEDYLLLSQKLNIPLHNVIRPYQAGGDKVSAAGAVHGGSGVLKDCPFKKVDGLVTAEKNVLLSIIAADCVPVYLMDKKAEVIGLLHCGWQSAAGELIHNGIDQMKSLGASPENIKIMIGPHICSGCYEVGEEVRTIFAESFLQKELEMLFSTEGGKTHLDLAQAVRLKAIANGVDRDNISDNGVCTCHNTSFYSYRRGDRGKQNLAYIIMK